ncbi:hypothetical protein AGMMS49975_27700 [Clostridia bacterium]|nr:hypothetical protein AGMMS49975_27700 [Clostridia bacterium]
MSSTQNEAQTTSQNSNPNPNDTHAVSNDALGELAVCFMEVGKQVVQMGERISIAATMLGGLPAEELSVMKTQVLSSPHSPAANAFHIARAVKAEETIDVPKSGEPRHTIIMDSEHSAYISERFSKLNPDEYILKTDDGDYLSRRTFDKRYKSFFNRLNNTMGDNDKIPHFTPYSARHTWVTLLTLHGYSENLIMKMAGHKDSKVTQGYTHIDKLETLRQMAQEEQDKLNK